MYVCMRAPYTKKCVTVVIILHACTYTTMCYCTVFTLVFTYCPWLMLHGGFFRIRLWQRLIIITTINPVRINAHLVVSQ